MFCYSFKIHFSKYCLINLKKLFAFASIFWMTEKYHMHFVNIFCLYFLFGVKTSNDMIRKCEKQTSILIRFFTSVVSEWSAITETYEPKLITPFTGLGTSLFIEYFTYLGVLCCEKFLFLRFWFIMNLISRFTHMSVSWRQNSSKKVL